MSIIEFKNVSKFFLRQKLYDNVNFTIGKRDKIVLLGHNGVGKSTLLRIITEEETYDDGEVIFEEDVTYSYFDQFCKIPMDKTVEQLLDLPFEEVIKTQALLDSVSSKFSNPDEDMEILMNSYSELNDKFESLGGYDYIHQQEEFSDIFGFSDKLQKTFGQLSGGERQYIRLAIALFSPKDLIILDEPLSFFDRKKTFWLSDFINKSNKAFLVISHNVDFIRTIATKVLHVHNYTITEYPCDFNTYLKEKKIKQQEDKKFNRKKDETIEETTKAFEKKQKLLERVDNKHAQAVILRRMERELEKLSAEKIELSPDYKYEYVARPEDVYTKENIVDGVLISLTDVSKAYPEKELFKNASLQITKETKIFLVGQNGVGKSTLLKILSGQETVDSGKVCINPKCKITYIAQESSFIDENIKVETYLQEKTGLAPDFVESAIASLFNNQDDFSHKRIYMLSGGEKKRLEIFANILSEANVLIIDEPTTYMDDYSRATIASMLHAFDGAVILVSHDKFLMRQLDFETFDIRDKLLRKKIFG